MKDKKIVLGVCGSIAAYKSADVASKLVQKGAQVAVVMTASATKFVTPLTFQTITRIRVMHDMFDTDSVLDSVHISMTDHADLILIAPATANVIGKMAHGIGDDMLTSIILAAACPIYIAPAMNDRMYKNAVVQDNMKLLGKRGMTFIEPEEGYLACGSFGPGRLASPDKIVAAVEKALRKSS